MNESSIEDGIVIQIRNNENDQWKSSRTPLFFSCVALMELSGGQKSLLSISLILAQIRRNPFCVYIFDEAKTVFEDDGVDRRGPRRGEHEPDRVADQRRNSHTGDPGPEHLASRSLLRGSRDRHQGRYFSW